MGCDICAIFVKTKSAVDLTKKASFGFKTSSELPFRQGSRPSLTVASPSHCSESWTCKLLDLLPFFFEGTTLTGLNSDPSVGHRSQYDVTSEISGQHNSLGDSQAVLSCYWEEMSRVHSVFTFVSSHRFY